MGDLGFNILLSVIGLAIYSLWKVREHLKSFDIKIFFKANKAFWIWAMSLQIIFAFLIHIAPDAAEAIKTMIGIDYSETMAFVTSGAMLGSAANAAVKKKLDKKE
jgi:predicted MPP superfamily phosphohydrolase